MRDPRFALATALFLACLGMTVPAHSQENDANTGCDATAGKADPATEPDRLSADGTAPGNAGSTGWTGGTGGALIGTNPQGASEDSPTWQPPTARGLDLAMTPEDIKKNGC
ncbi:MULTISPECIES: hypothetical protein [Ensifer]|jgi:hypothetical protein|uniref:hypothetical protein n=2 Tax=Sinorhizobium/Ensifer group TaxID=227292 RepID=UPI00046D6EC2|nr:MULTISPECIES: hypothetical protein [Ensifer]